MTRGSISPGADDALRSHRAGSLEGGGFPGHGGAPSRGFYEGDVPWCYSEGYKADPLKWSALKAFLADLPDRRVAVEVACGPGTYLTALQGVAAHVIGVDISRRALRRGGPFEGISLVQGDALRLPLGDGVVDLLVMVDALEHLPLQRTLDEVRRVLRGEGTFIVIGYTENNPWSIPWALRMLGSSWEALTGDHLGHINPFSPRRLRRELEARGFSLRAMSFTSHLPRQLRSLAPHLLKRLKGWEDPGGLGTVARMRRNPWLRSPSSVIDALEERLTGISFTAEEVMVKAVLGSTLMD